MPYSDDYCFSIPQGYAPIVISSDRFSSSWASFVLKGEATKTYDVKCATFGAMGPKGLNLAGENCLCGSKVVAVKGCTLQVTS